MFPTTNQCEHAFRLFTIWLSIKLDDSFCNILISPKSCLGWKAHKAASVPLCDTWGMWTLTLQLLSPSLQSTHQRLLAWESAIHSKHDLLGGHRSELVVGTPASRFRHSSVCLLNFRPGRTRTEQIFILWSQMPDKWSCFIWVDMYSQRKLHLSF